MMDHSENKTITQFLLLVNEIVPELLQSSVQQTCILQEYLSQNALATDCCVDSILVVWIPSRMHVC